MKKKEKNAFPDWAGSEGLMLREPLRRISVTCYRGKDLATIRVVVYFLSLLLAPSWPKLRFAKIEYNFQTFLFRFSC